MQRTRLETPFNNDFGNFLEKESNMPAPLWQVGGQWFITQDNGFLVTLNLNQNGGQVDGACSHSNNTVQSREARGSVTNEEFEINIKWSNGTEGRYIGRFEPGHFTTGNQAILKGATVDLQNPNSSSGWEAKDKVFTRA